MKQNTILILAATAALAVPASASAESFQKFYNAFLPKLAKAFDTKDVSFFDQITTPDCKDVSPQGTMDKKSAMAEMRQEMKAVTGMKCKVKPLTSKVSGSTAKTSIWMWAEMSSKGADGKVHTMSMEVIESQSWVKVGSTWKINRLTEGKPTNVKMDGKSAPASAVGG